MDQLLLDFGALLGIPDLSRDETGRCHLVFDNTFLLKIKQSPGENTLLLSCALPYPTKTPEVLLRANYASTGKAVGWFCLDEKDCVCIQKICSPATSMSAQDLLVEAEALINYAEMWHNRMQEEGKPSVPKPQSKSRQSI